MLKKLKYFGLLLVMLIITSMQSVQAEDFTSKKIYQCTWTDEQLTNPTSWISSSYFNNPIYKEVRFQDYGTKADIPAGTPRETSFYMTYGKDGLNIFFQSNEPETDTEGKLKGSSLEIFLSPGIGDVPYYQMIAATATGDVEYYDWQTENRNYHPLKGNISVVSEQVPGGWGTSIVIPWECFYNELPLNSDYWRFSVMRWSPKEAFTWGGNVHETGQFNLIYFQPPTQEQRTSIQKSILAKAWQKFNTAAGQLTYFWDTDTATSDKVFYSDTVKPLIDKYTAYGNQMSNLEQLSSGDIENLFNYVHNWMELEYDVEDYRGKYLKMSIVNPIPSNVPDCDTEHPHMIYTKQDLDNIRKHVVDGKVTGYFKLANDIVFDDSDFQEGGEFFNNGLGWIPIGHNNELLEYSGLKSNINLDGAGFSITNLKVFGPSTRYGNGFIAGPENSTIKNVRFYKTRIETWCGIGVVYAASYGNTVVENVVIDEAVIINRGGAAKPSGILASQMKGTANNITIKNSTLTHIDLTTGVKGFGWRQALFAGALLENSKVNNVIISNCTGVFYAYAGLFATHTESGVEVNNVSITDSKVTWTHYSYFNFLGNSYTPNTGRENVLLNNIYVDAEFVYDYIENISNNNRLLIPSESGFNMTNAVINFKQNKNKEVYTVANPLNPDNLDNVFITRNYLSPEGTSMEIKNICAAGSVRTEPAFIGAMELETGKTTSFITLSNGARISQISGLKFKTSNSSVATVSTEGTVSTISRGIALVSAYATVNGQDYTIGSTEITVNGEDTIVSINPTDVITAAGSPPVLPTVVTAVYNSNTIKLVNVIWDAVNPLDYARGGSFVVNGTVEGISIKAVANVTVTNTAASTLKGANIATTGEQFEVVFGLAGVEGISAQDISLSYYSSKFKFVGAESVLSGTSVSEATYNAEEGTIRLIIASAGASNAISGTSDIVSLKFNSIASGTGNIEVTNAMLSNGIGDVIFADATSKTITVDADKTALIAAISAAKDISNSTVEGIETGMYPGGTKARLNTEIAKAEAISVNVLTAEQVAQAIEDLNRALSRFQSLVITNTTGDINKIAGHDIGDLGIVSYNYGKKAGDEGWDAIKKADINGDGEIGLYDLAFVAKKILGN